MSRSAADATRFTATSPHAYAKPSSIRHSAASNTFSPSSAPRSQPQTLKSKSSPPSPAPRGHPSVVSETPAEKVARLRAAHAAQKLAQASTWDKIVLRGRVVADVAHRFTALGLIGLTVLAGGVATFSLADMVMYNRQKRKLFFQEQHELLQKRLAEAKEALAKGAADDDQMLLINQERAAAEAEQARRAKKGIWGSIKGVFTTDGLKKEDTGNKLQVLSGDTEKQVGEQSTFASAVAKLDEQTGDAPGLGILEAVEEKRREGELGLQNPGTKGGPLDELAENVTSAAKSKRGWTSWLTST